MKLQPFKRRPLVFFTLMSFTARPKDPSAFWKSSTVKSVLKQTNYLKAIAFSCLKKIKCRAVSVIILQRGIKRVQPPHHPEVYTSTILNRTSLKSKSKMEGQKSKLANVLVSLP